MPSEPAPKLRQIVSDWKLLRSSSNEKWNPVANGNPGFRKVPQPLTHRLAQRKANLGPPVLVAKEDKYLIGAPT